MKRWILPLSLGAVTFVLYGCEPKTAVAPRTDVIASNLENFPRKDIEFHSNQLFLWPPGVTPQKVSRVLFLSDEIDRLESKIGPLKNRLDQLDIQLHDVDESIRIKRLEVSSKVSRINRKKEDLRRKNEQLDSAQQLEQQERAKSAPDPDVLRRLTVDQEALGNQRTILSNEMRILESQKATVEQDIVNLSQNPLLQERERLRPEKKLDEDTKAEHLREVTNIVTWYDPQPAEIGFHFLEDGGIKVWIRGWCLNREEMKEWEFSTVAEDGKKPTIENVKYREYGGLFEFDVKVYEDEEQTQLREFYSFRIARTKYNSGDGKIYYTGTMKRTRVNPDGTLEVRDGIAKLVDKNN